MIRIANINEVDIIHKLLDTEPFKYDDSIPYDRTWIEDLVKHCIVLVYESDDVIKGFICGERLIGNFAMLWFCAVGKDYQNGIIGPKLYLEFENHIKNLGMDGVLVYGYKTSEGMLRKAGYHTNERMYKEFYKSI